MRLNSPAVSKEAFHAYLRNFKGDLTSEEPRVSHHNSKRTPWSLPHLEMRADSPALTSEESRFSHQTSRGGLSHLLKLEWYPHSSCHKSKGHRDHPQLEIRQDSPERTRIEPRVFPHNMKGGRNPRCTSRKSPSSPSDLNRRFKTAFTTQDERGVPCLNMI